MTDGSNDRLGRIEALLEHSIVKSDERITRLEQRLEQSTKASDGRLTRIEQTVESNNCFLESFSQDLKSYTDSMSKFVT